MKLLLNGYKIPVCAKSLKKVMKTKAISCQDINCEIEPNLDCRTCDFYGRHDTWNLCNPSRVDLRHIQDLIIEEEN